MSAGENWEAASLISASRYRTDTIAALIRDGPATPSQLAAELGHDISHVSRALSSLREHGLAELKVPEDTRKGRFYDVTSAGEAAYGLLENGSGEAGEA